MNSITFAEQRFHTLWLRDNCLCSTCRHSNGQRLHETWQLNPEPVVARHHVEAEGLQVWWQEAEGEHASFYPAAWLAQHAYDRAAERDPERQLWGSEKQGQLARFAYPDVLRDPAVKRDWLAAVARDGVALLQAVPTEPGTILKVVEQFGFVRHTNYGDLFDVVTEEQPINLAYTPIPLSLHTDNPYRDPVPSLQLLHCLVQAEQGGITALCDGFYAAERLRQQDPEAFARLSEQPVDFRFASEDAELSHRGPMIELDPQGQVRGVRINNRSSAPFRLPFEIMSDYYRAYQSLVALMHSEACKITLKLGAGELVLFDNQRVLHGREVQAIGARHLQGCYADRDGLRSSLAVLARN